MPKTLFELLKKSLPQLGYRLAESGRERVGHAVAQGARRLWSDQLASNGKNRKQVKDESGFGCRFNLTKLKLASLVTHLQ